MPGKRRRILSKMQAVGMQARCFEEANLTLRRTECNTRPMSMADNRGLVQVQSITARQAPPRMEDTRDWPHGRHVPSIPLVLKWRSRKTEGQGLLRCYGTTFIFGTAAVG